MLFCAGNSATVTVYVCRCEIIIIQLRRETDFLRQFSLHGRNCNCNVETEVVIDANLIDDSAAGVSTAQAQRTARQERARVRPRVFARVKPENADHLTNALLVEAFAVRRSALRRCSSRPRLRAAGCVFLPDTAANSRRSIYAASNCNLS